MNSILFAKWMRFRFFVAIVFRPLPHSEITGGIFWPLHAWQTSLAIEQFWRKA